MKRIIAFLLTSVTLFHIVACARPMIPLEPETEPATRPTAEPTATEIAQVQPTNTSKPTNTPRPTATSTREPTDTPEPTQTKRPTRTPRPTKTVEIETTTPIPTKTPFPTELPATDIPPATESPAASTTNINTVADMADGERVIINGNVVFTESFSRGFKFTVADETGRVIVLLWDSTYDTLPGRNTLNIGSNITVTGKVGRYENDLQITPYEAANVVINTPAYAWGELVAVSGLRPKLNQRVMVEGTISRSNTNQYGTELFINDGTGEVEVFVWNNIFQRMPNQDAVKTAGTQVRVVGRVDDYRNTLQLLPALPYDVVVR